MSILDINIKNQSKHFRKTILTYLILSILAIVVNKVYALFGHGVSSPAMTWMFLYPLIGGALFYFLIYGFANKIIKFTLYRLFFNIFNSGIATLTFGSFLKGVMDIAGSGSIYLVFYYVVGGLFIAAGLILMFIMVINQKRADA
ncbi:MAG: putative rane protein [Clostridia bacterium]|nr:putative rane protein [Clostridia bacterium]